MVRSQTPDLHALFDDPTWADIYKKQFSSLIEDIKESETPAETEEVTRELKNLYLQVYLRIMEGSLAYHDKKADTPVVYDKNQDIIEIPSPDEAFTGVLKRLKDHLSAANIEKWVATSEKIVRNLAQAISILDGPRLEDVYVEDFRDLLGKIYRDYQKMQQTIRDKAQQYELGKAISEIKNMKVTKSKLKRIIREELQKINERTPGPPILRGGASFDLGFTDDGRSYDILLTPAMKTSVEQAAAAIAGPHISVEKVQATIEAHLKELLLTDRSTDGKNPTTKPVSKSDYGAAEAAREIFDGLEDPKSEELQKANITPDMEAIIKDELQRPGAATYCGGDAVKWIKFYLTQLLSDGEISRMLRSPGSSECWIPVAKKVYARIKNGAEEEFKPAHVGTSLQHGDQTVYAKGNKK
jgi:hypothetical protein